MTLPTAVHFPFPSPPDPGALTEVAPGLFWVRLPLPFRLDHVNIYLVEDGGGYAVIDTGIGDEATQQAWSSLLEGFLRTRPLTRVILTHFHSDHAGMAGWLCERFGIPLLMSQTEYLQSLILLVDPSALDAEPYRSFYRGQGMDADTTDKLLGLGQRYLRMLTGLPRTFRRLIAGEALRIGHRTFEVLTGGGHSPEQVMLYCPAEKLLLAADQVLARISPNISVHAMDPQGDPLGIYLRSLSELKRRLPADTLVVPGHNLPFTGLHARLNELAAHHAERCTAIAEACRGRGCTTAELVPVVFRRPINDPHQMGFAFSEALAHVNFMQRQERLRFTGGRYHAVPDTELTA